MRVAASFLNICQRNPVWRSMKPKGFSNKSYRHWTFVTATWFGICRRIGTLNFHKKLYNSSSLIKQSSGPEAGKLVARRQVQHQGGWLRDGFTAGRRFDARDELWFTPLRLSRNYSRWKVRRPQSWRLELWRHSVCTVGGRTAIWWWQFQGFVGKS